MSLEKERMDFDEGFDKWMSSTIEYEMLMRQRKPIPSELLRRITESIDWLNGLSDEDYHKLIG